MKQESVSPFDINQQTLIEESYWIYKKITELENHHLTSILVTIKSGKKHQHMLKPIGAHLMGIWYLYSPKCSPYKVIIPKGEREDLHSAENKQSLLQSSAERYHH